MLSRPGTPIFSTPLVDSLSLRRQLYTHCNRWESTSEAEGVMPGQWVGKARLVVVLVDGSHTRRIPTAGRTGAHNGIAEAAVG